MLVVTMPIMFPPHAHHVPTTCPSRDPRMPVTCPSHAHHLRIPHQVGPDDVLAWARALAGGSDLRVHMLAYGNLDRAEAVGGGGGGGRSRQCREAGRLAPYPACACGNLDLAEAVGEGRGACSEAVRGGSQ